MAFFGERTAPGDVLVAETGHVIAGYAALGQSVPLASHSHVLEIRGLAVHPAHQRSGVGRRLVEACIEQARSRGARKLSLRVLGGNVAARRLYESCGFIAEGILREEFFLGGRYVDDVLHDRSGRWPGGMTGARRQSRHRRGLDMTRAIRFDESEVL
jgi:ribosomal protein S18 acetylase RimI-like enzyme